MLLFQALQEELRQPPISGTYLPDYYRYIGFREAIAEAPAAFRAHGVYTLFTRTTPVILKNELIVGNRFCLYVDKDPDFLEQIKQRMDYFSRRNFYCCWDHYIPNYRHTLAVGVPGLIAEVDASLKTYQNDPKKVETLTSMRHTLCGFQQLIRNYAAAAERCKADPAYDPARLDFIIENCAAIAAHKPETFAQALQLVWLCQSAMEMEGRGAMALGRMDQYLYPFYKADMEAGRTTDAQVTELLENLFIRLEDETVNICIGGQNPQGECEVNELSRCILHAVDNCHIPGPNLSLRLTANTPDEFFDECLQVIGTGLGYPALMNDEVHLAALKRYGYADEDLYDYAMVGCIENFISGKQPAWSDGRFNTPLYLACVFNGDAGTPPAEINDHWYLDAGPWFYPTEGADEGDLEHIHSMADFMAAFEKRLAFGADVYCARFNRQSHGVNNDYLPDPFLSCFCEDCIGRGLDINNGGARYPSVHGACLMGVGTVVDSLAAIEKVVFIDKEATLWDIKAALKANFEGYEDLQQKLLAAPKYGNNDDFVDKYAVWFIDYLYECFSKHRIHDGGHFYLAAASNTANILFGATTGATPDGRNQGEPISDAASPTYGRDTRGPTASICSLSKPDYTKVGTGSVVNQKYSPNMFSDEKRSKLAALIRTYFKRGGQEIQINSTSRTVLIDAMEHPENYPNLVVRVSGFSAYYTRLGREIQTDILNRTQQG